MGVLETTDGGRRCVLLARHRVGRHPSCDLRLTAPSISGEHAALQWTGRGWVVRDLGSRNGTRVDGEVVPPGQATPLALGSALTFGLEPVEWHLVEAGAPDARAVAVDGEREVVALDGLLALPGPDAPDVMIYRHVGGAWVAEQDGRLHTVTDLQSIEAGGTHWRVHLPDPIPQTWEAGEAVPTLETIALLFEVSLDEEHVHLWARYRERRIDLDSRVYHYTLLTLARLRLQDRSGGWVHPEALCAMLRLDLAMLNVHVYRARRHLAQAGIVGAARIVERRGSTRELRLGTDDLEVVRLE